MYVLGIFKYTCQLYLSIIENKTFCLTIFLVSENSVLFIFYSEWVIFFLVVVFE